MTDDELTALEKLCESASDLPLTVTGPSEHAGCCYVVVGDPCTAMYHFGNTAKSLEDAQFFVASRTALPFLIAEVRCLREQVAGHGGPSNPASTEVMPVRNEE